MTSEKLSYSSLSRLCRRSWKPLAAVLKFCTAEKRESRGKNIVLNNTRAPHVQKVLISDIQHRLTKWHFVHAHLIRVPLCHLCNDLCIFLQRVCILISIKGKQLGVRQQEDESSSDLSHCSEPLEGWVIKLLYYLEGFIHGVIDGVAAVFLSFLKGHRPQSNAINSLLNLYVNSVLFLKMQVRVKMQQPAFFWSFYYAVKHNRIIFIF